jgi:hypothetical protein
MTATHVLDPVDRPTRMVRLAEADEVAEHLHRDGHRALAAVVMSHVAAHRQRASLKPFNKAPKAVPFHPPRLQDAFALDHALRTVRGCR